MRVTAELRPWGAWADVVVLLGCAALLGTCVSFVGCVPPACSPQALGELEAAYVAEAVAACQGHTRATCQEMPAIEAKYRAKREEWIACRK